MVMSSKWMRLIGLVGFTAVLVSCKQTPQAPMNANYATMKITVSDKKFSPSYSATIRGRQDIDIYPQVSGTIERLCVTEGEKVRKGQILFVIDQVPYKAALNTAIGNVKKSGGNFAGNHINFIAIRRGNQDISIFRTGFFQNIGMCCFAENRLNVIFFRNHVQGFGIVIDYDNKLFPAV